MRIRVVLILPRSDTEDDESQLSQDRAQENATKSEGSLELSNGSRWGKRRSLAALYLWCLDHRAYLQHSQKIKIQLGIYKDWWRRIMTQPLKRISRQTFSQARHSDVPPRPPHLPTCVPLLVFSAWTICLLLMRLSALRYQSQPCSHRKWHAGMPSWLRHLAVILDCCDGEIEAWLSLASSRITSTNSNRRSGIQWD